jgi:non-ribosomal peptide synthetase component E (peptide arylation enzyme)
MSEGMYERISDYVDYHAARTPDSEALVLGDLRLSYRDLKTRVDLCAAALVKAGIVKGDRVAT